MQGVHDGFVKLFCRPGTGLIEGGVIVAPRASELIHPVALAVSERLTADQLAHAFTVYPSMSGSVAEAARRLHRSVHRAPEEVVMRSVPVGSRDVARRHLSSPCRRPPRPRHGRRRRRARAAT